MRVHRSTSIGMRCASVSVDGAQRGRDRPHRRRPACRGAGAGRPVLDVVPGLRVPPLLLGARDQEADRAVGQLPERPHQAERVADGRAHPVRADDQIRLVTAAVGEDQHPFRFRARHFRTRHDLGARLLRRRRQRIDAVLPDDREHPHRPARRPFDARDGVVPVVPHLARAAGEGAPRGGFVGAHRLEHLQPVLVDVDARARGAQPVAGLVDADAPAALGEGRRGGQPGEPGAGDLDVPPRRRHRRAIRRAPRSA